MTHKVYDNTMPDNQLKNQSKKMADSNIKAFTSNGSELPKSDPKREREDDTMENDQTDELDVFEPDAHILLDEEPLEDEDEEYTDEEGYTSSSSEGGAEDEDFMIVQEEIQKDMDPEYGDSPFDPIDPANILPEKRRSCSSTKCQQ